MHIMTRGGILQRMRTAGLSLALFALAFKALLPPGFMLTANADSIAITLCSGGQAYFDPATGEVRHDAPDSDSQAQHCPFALVGAPALIAPSETAAAPTFTHVLDTASRVRQAIGVHKATGPPLPARGPPLQA